MAKAKWLSVAVAAAVLVLVLGLAMAMATPLEDYVNAPDPYFSWKVNSQFENSVMGYKGYVLELISQKWMTINETNSPIWRHWLTLCVPDQPDTAHADNAFLYLDGGHITDSPPKTFQQESGLLAVEIVCLSSSTVSAHLSGIPNEPLIFLNDTKRRSEDALIAYAWRHFLNHTNDPIWLPRLPMVKAAVKAMDAIEQFTEKQLGYKVNKFVVAGASKRGWTTWLTGVVDKRVIAMIPMVMPILNIVPNMNWHYRAYGGWSFALDDYLAQGIMAYLNDPQFLKLAEVVDPYSFKDRLTLPKMVMTACGDEFFLPDSPQFFIHDLPGETFLNLIPNAEHALFTRLDDVAESLTSFYQLIITQTPRPTYTYTMKRSNTTAVITITATGSQTPTTVQMWSATTLSVTQRDFRLVKCSKIPDCIQPVIWLYTTLQETSPGSRTWSATVDAPSAGWTGFLIEMLYEYNLPPFVDFTRTFRVTTEVNIVPDYMPFPPCGDHCQ